MSFKLKRVYDAAEEGDGYRVLVDRLWPRGISKKELKLDIWMKEIAPSSELRKWFDHDPEKFPEFNDRYHKELEKRTELVDELAKKSSEKTVTLLYAARDKEINHALTLKKHLEESLG